MNYDFIYFIGDSFTYAIKQKDDILGEITEHNRFSNLIGQHYNLPVVNQGMPGCSNHTIFKKLYDDVYRYVSENKKFLVVLSYTDFTRLELYHNQRKENVTISDLFSFYKDYIVESFDFKNCKELTLHYILAMHTLLERFNIDYVEAFTNEIHTGLYSNKKKCLEETFMEIINVDGRLSQNGHPNTIGHDRIAKEFIKKIDELYGTN